MKQIIKFIQIIIVICYCYNLGGYGAEINQSIHLQYCGNIVKDQFYQKAKTYQQNGNVENSIQYMFPADSFKFGQGLLSTNFSMIQQSIKGSQVKYGINFGIILLFAFLHIIVIPLILLILCCTKKQKKQINKSKTTCFNYLPYICIGFLFIVIVVLCAIVLKNNGGFLNQYTDFKCSLAIITNDLLEGGNYNNGSIQFKGLKYYLVLFQSFIQNVTNSNRTIQQNLINASKSMNTAISQINIISSSNSKVSNDSGSQLYLQYAYPLLENINNGYQNSTFPSILGTNITKNTLIGNMSDKINVINNSLMTISSFAGNFNRTASFVNVSQGYNEVATVVRNVENTQYNIGTTIDILDEGVLKTYSVFSYVSLGFTLFIVVITCIGITCFSCMNNQSCRNKIFVCCTFLWIVGILHFFLALIFTLLNPVVFHGCQYVREGVSNSSGFQNYFGGRNTTDFIGHCLINENDTSYFYEMLLNKSIRGNITQLKKSFPSFINGSKQLEELNTSYMNLSATVQNYRTARILDIENPSMIDQIKSMSLTDDCFQDSWIPSLHQIPQIIPCTLNSSALNADNGTCHDVNVFETRGVGCVGCIDMFLVLQMYDNYTDLLNSMTKRYQQCVDTGKGDLITKLSNLWYNYDNPKKATIGYVKQKVDGMVGNINELTKQINNSIQPSYNIVKRWIDNDPIFQQNPNQTLAKEMNCKVIGVGIDNSVSILCNAGLVYVYNLRFMYSAIAVAIYLACVCLICLTRKKKQQKIIGENEIYDDNNYLINDKNIQLKPVPQSQRKQSLAELNIQSKQSLPS